MHIFVYIPCFPRIYIYTHISICNNINLTVTWPRLEIRLLLDTHTYLCVYRHPLANAHAVGIIVHNSSNARTRRCWHGKQAASTASASTPSLQVLWRRAQPSPSRRFIYVFAIMCAYVMSCAVFLLCVVETSSYRGIISMAAEAGVYAQCLFKICPSCIVIHVESVLVSPAL